MNNSRTGSVLVFPVLRYLQEQEEGSNFRRYVLDWSPVENYAEINFKRFLARNGQSDDVATFLPTFPSPYDDEIKQIVFKLPRQVEREIRYFTRMAKEVWEEERDLPDNLMDATMEVALVNANTAFNILREFVEDTTDLTKNRIHWHGILYKFWNGQINTALIKQYAAFGAIQGLINHDDTSTEDKKTYLDFMEQVNAYEKARQELFGTLVKKDEVPVQPTVNETSATASATEGE
jgi:hypothetical protein